MKIQEYGEGTIDDGQRTTGTATPKVSLDVKNIKFKNCFVTIFITHGPTRM
jgi:hypothetical protein